jgi:hypothetical protein
MYFCNESSNVCDSEYETTCQRFYADGLRNIRQYYADIVSCLSINTNVTRYFHADVNCMTMLWIVALSSVMNF